MAKTLEENWQHEAFVPGLQFHPDTVLTDRAALKRQADFEDLQREISGVNGNRVNRFTGKDGDLRTGRGADTRNSGDIISRAQLHEIGSAGWQASYNNELNLNVGGQDYEVSQGRVHEWALSKEEQYRRELEEAQANGASPERIAELERAIRAADRLGQATDPRYGNADPGTIQGIIGESPLLGRDFQEDAEDLQPDGQTAALSDELTANRTDVDQIPTGDDTYRAAFSGGATFSGGLDDLPGNEVFKTQGRINTPFVSASSLGQDENRPAATNSDPENILTTASADSLTEDQELAGDAIKNTGLTI